MSKKGVRHYLILRGNRGREERKTDRKRKEKKRGCNGSIPLLISKRRRISVQN